jgi:DNA polymerase-3 subunit beta
MTTLLIETKLLRAALICASDAQTRHYICGAYIDPKGYVVSTDGHRMFVGAFDLRAGLDAGAPEPVGFEGWIIPREVLKRVLTGNKQFAIEVAPDMIDGQRYAPVDGTFPDYRRVMPAAPLSGETAQFNPDYVADMGRIGALLTGKKDGLRAHIHHNGTGPAGVEFIGCDTAFGVLMPIRGGTSTWEEATSFFDPA